MRTQDAGRVVALLEEIGAEVPGRRHRFTKEDRRALGV